MDILIFGMGRADTMARRRQLSEEKVSQLLEKGAVGEAFGHYFDINGNDIWESLTVGLSLEGYSKIDRVIGVAGGEDRQRLL